MKRILITSGGTVEPIDNVRRIANLSRGRLGAKISDELHQYDEVEKIFFLYARGSEKPFDTPSKVKLITFTDVESLQTTAYDLLRTEGITDIIHAAAVSDYKVAEVTGPGGLSLEKAKKISSSLSELNIRLIPTPKVISQFKTISPASNLIGFKLLYDAPVDELVAAAQKTLRDNDCSYVLANRLVDVKDNQHKAYLVDSSGVVETFETKRDIAEGLARYIGLPRKWIYG